MTTLPTKAVRDGLNIDRHDRALTWAALAMRSAVLLDSAQSALIPNIKVAHNLYQNGEFRLSLEVRFPYDSVAFLKSGGEFGENIGAFTLSVAPDPARPFLISLAPEITSEPVWVNTLEKYCYWNALALLKKSHYTTKTIDIKLNEESYPNTYISIAASFSLDPQLFFGGSSYVDSFFQTQPRT